jgi:hypothetical protein
MRLNSVTQIDPERPIETQTPQESFREAIAAKLVVNALKK